VINWARVHYNDEVKFTRVFARASSILATMAFVLLPGSVHASTDTPPLTVAGRETFDLFDVPQGTDKGTAVLNKLQLSGTLHGDDLGLDGWSFHAQIFRFDGQSLSKHLGDIQTADNIEAVPATRLFEAYLSRLWKSGDHSVGVRLGLIDLNNQFDSIDTASIMLNSSHGVGPDLSRSGRSGPSIYPVTALGTTVTWVSSPAWTIRLGIFDGVAGNPDHPHAFVAERLKPNDGLFVIGQIDRQVSKNAVLEAGLWGYSAAQQGPTNRRAHDRGAYVSYEAPLALLPKLDFWLRAGFADRQAQTVSGYLGGGLVQEGTFSGRTKDRIGFAIAHAIVSLPAQKAFQLSGAETTFELTYQAVFSRSFVVQPDIAYVHHPAGFSNAQNSLGVGLRFVFVTAHPVRMEATDPGDPTIPPDGSLSTAD